MAKSGSLKGQLWHRGDQFYNKTALTYAKLIRCLIETHSVTLCESALILFTISCSLVL